MSNKPLPAKDNSTKVASGNPAKVAQKKIPRSRSLQHIVPPRKPPPSVERLAKRRRRKCQYTYNMPTVEADNDATIEDDKPRDQGVQKGVADSVSSKKVLKTPKPARLKEHHFEPLELNPAMLKLKDDVSILNSAFDQHAKNMETATDRRALPNSVDGLAFICDVVLTNLLKLQQHYALGHSLFG